MRGGNLVFVVVVVAAYVSIFAATAERLSPAKTVLLLVLGAIYLLVGVFGWGECERRDSWRAAAIYFAFQIPLGTTITLLSNFSGFTGLILLPLPGQSVGYFSGYGVTAVSVFVIAAMALSIGLEVNWTTAAWAAISYSTGVIFVVVFSRIAVREERARAEVERLAGELRQANQKLRLYATQVEELATTKERNRLAREIHDSLGHYLTVINVQIKAAHTILDNDRERALDALQKAQALTQEGLTEVRRSVAALRASPTENRSLAEAIAGLVQECQTAGILTELLVTGSPYPLPPTVELTLYRAAQEGLTNMRKHARASQADVTLDFGDKTAVRLLVCDNGVGTAAPGDGFGLLGVRERVQLLGGTVTIQTGHREGFTLEVVIPVSGSGLEDRES